jgi:transposase
MEACGGAHYWGRWLSARGFGVKLMAPREVKPYRAGPHKSDARDAEACAEAGSRPRVKAVRVKSEAAQRVQALSRIRTRRVRQLVQTANQLRGLLAEFGLVAPKGRGRLLKAVAGFRASGALPEPIRPFVEDLLAEVESQMTAVAEATKTLEAEVGKDEAAALFLSVPFLGPINAAALSVALVVPSDFRDGRAFAAHLGFVPRQDKSGESDRTKGIVRQSANDLRACLVCAAQSLLTRVGRLEEEPKDRFLAWARRLKARKPRNLAAAAVAGKLARIAWSVAASGRPYAPRLAA